MSRTFVICAPETDDVIGFYSLANGAVQRAAATKRLQRNAPDPIPVMVLGRLAVAEAWERRGLGRSLLRDAVLRTVQAGEIAGVAAILVHAKSDEAAEFYRRFGFSEAELHPLTLMLPLATIKYVMA